LVVCRAAAELRAGTQSHRKCWGNLKSTELANLCITTIGQVADMLSMASTASELTPRCALPSCTTPV
jgi:hypothetical protein